MSDTTPTQATGIDTAAIRAAAQNLSDGPVTAGYKGDREAVLKMLNDALATELVCINRYKRHYYTVSGKNNAAVKAEFLEHAQEEEQHADWLAERIVQLNGAPDYNPATLHERSHAEYDESLEVQSMVRANLIAERVAIEAYRQMIEQLGDNDPVTKQLLVKIMAEEEEHADDMRDMLE